MKPNRLKVELAVSSQVVLTQIAAQVKGAKADRLK